MKKVKIVLLGTVLLGIGGVIAFDNSHKDLSTSTVEEKQNIQENVSESLSLVEEIELITSEDESTDKVDNIEINESTNNSFSASNNSVENKATSSQDATDVSNNNETSSSTSVESQTEKVKTQEAKQEETLKTYSTGKAVSFYESITHGKKEFYTEEEALNRGLEIAQNELNYVMDYNQAHPDAQISPDINYYRVYPSYVDENGHTWYYLHFFCQSGEGNDSKLKNTY